MKHKRLQRFALPAQWDDSAEALRDFRARFQASLRDRVRQGDAVEEGFGRVWMETAEEIPLSEQGQAELFDELLQWTRQRFLRGYSPRLFTEAPPVFRENLRQ